MDDYTDYIENYRDYIYYYRECHSCGALTEIAVSKGITKEEAYNMSSIEECEDLIDYFHICRWCKSILYDSNLVREYSSRDECVNAEAEYEKKLFDTYILGNEENQKKYDLRKKQEQMIKDEEAKRVEEEIERIRQQKELIREQLELQEMMDRDDYLKCPVCGSHNIRKIGSFERGFSVALLGLISDKIGKTFECQSCGYKW